MHNYDPTDHELRLVERHTGEIQCLENRHKCEVRKLEDLLRLACEHLEYEYEGTITPEPVYQWYLADRKKRQEQAEKERIEAEEAAERERRAEFIATLTYEESEALGITRAKEC